MSIPLGPFQLRHPVGQGGMGVVWLAHHTGQDVPVAVKVITTRQIAAEVYQRAFQQEVRAVSALDHPGIVWIFDSGTIPAETARASGGALVEGSPYLVMEYASRGTLKSLGRTLTWPELRAVLMSLLDALAHAHARGVLHRDLKPDNVLIAGHEDLRPGFKLTDFGIAHPMEDTTGGIIEEERPIGTPQYMAPEQIRSDTHIYGPHTDLYALGCLAWRLATGKVPFHGVKGPSLMYAQLTKEPPAFEPAFPVPDELEDLLRLLLRKEPHERFQRAADAAVALARVPDPPGALPTAALRLDPIPCLEPLDPSEAPTEAHRMTEAEELDLDTATLRILTSERPSASEARDPSVRPRLPSTWHLRRSASRPLRLLGAGLGLFGLRPIPYVGREHERDVLWHALGAVHRSGRARAVVVRSAAGMGRSRLVDWIADRAHEVGGAHVIRTSFSSPRTAAEQLRRTLARFLRSWTMSKEDRDRRIGELASGWDVRGLGLAATVEALLDPERLPLHESHRQQVVRRVWEMVAADRPLLLVFDDVQWGVEALALVRQLLDTQETRPAPVLALLTALDAEVDPHSEAGRGIAGLPNRDSVDEVTLAELPGEERGELVRELLGLDEALAEAVAGRTGGNPLFAVQLVGDQVERGLLEAGPSGFTLRDPEQALPDSLQQVFEGRIRQLVRGLVAPALQMLERAAVLGREIDVLEWQAACDDPLGQHAAAGMLYFNPRHARLRQALMDRLLARGLAQESPVGFVFTHAQLRDAAVERSRRAGRFREHALACANALRHRGEPGDAERVGRFLVDARRPEEAIEPLLAGVEWTRKAAGSAAALDLLGVVQDALEAAHIPPSDRRWAELFVHLALDLRALDQHAAAEAAALQATKLSAASRWDDLGAEALSVLGSVALARGDHAGAEERFLEAIRHLGEGGDAYARVRTWHKLWRLAWQRGDTLKARARASEIAAIHAMEPRARAAAHAARAEHALAAGDLDEGAALAERALEVCVEAADLPGQARALGVLASVAERRERLSEARDHLSRCVDVLEEIGSTQALLWRCRLAWIEGRSGHFAGARAAVEPALTEGDPEDPRLRAAAHVCLAMAAAGRGRWDAFDTHLSVCEGLFAEVTAPDAEYGAVAELAGDLAMQRRQRERAVRAWTLAKARYEALGDAEHAEAVRYRIATLGAP